MRKKTMITAAFLALILTTATACGDKQPAENQNSALPLESEAENQSTPSATEDESGTDTTLPSENDETDTSSETAPDDSTPNDLPATVNKDTTTIGGIVRSVAQDSFVISRTLIDDSDDGGSYVTIPGEGSPEEELVTIRCTDKTTFELWTIQGGGADITTNEASFSDIQSGGGLEAEGSYDGEDFIAERVIIEIFE